MDWFIGFLLPPIRGKGYCILPLGGPKNFITHKFGPSLPNPSGAAFEFGSFFVFLFFFVSFSVKHSSALIFFIQFSIPFSYTFFTVSALEAIFSHLFVLLLFLLSICESLRDKGSSICPS